MVQIIHLQKVIISLKNYFQKETKVNAPCAVCAEQISPTIHPSALDLALVLILLVKGAQRSPLPLPIHTERLTSHLWAPHHPGRVTRQALSKCHTPLYADSQSRVSTARNWQSLNSEHPAPEPGGCTCLGKPRLLSLESNFFLHSFFPGAVPGSLLLC